MLFRFLLTEMENWWNWRGFDGLVFLRYFLGLAFHRIFRISQTTFPNKNAKNLHTRYGHHLTALLWSTNLIFFNFKAIFFCCNIKRNRQLISIALNIINMRSMGGNCSEKWELCLVFRTRYFLLIKWWRLVLFQSFEWSLSVCSQWNMESGISCKNGVSWCFVCMKSPSQLSSWYFVKYWGFQSILMKWRRLVLFWNFKWSLLVDLN